MSNLTKIRGKHGLSQEELGAKIGLTRAGMSYLEKTSLNARQAIKIAEVLHENVFELLGEDILKIKPQTEEDKRYLINLIERM